MKAWVELWVRLKVVDLVAETAWMTLTGKLEFGSDLCGLLHYSYWGMYAEGKDNGVILNEVDRVVRMDSAFTNQNKHLYRLAIKEPVGEFTSDRGDLPLEKDFPVRDKGIDPAVDRNIFSIDCLVRERDGEREKGFTDRLNTRLRGISVSGLKTGEIWRILIRAAAKKDALEIVERMAVTRSRREGLLLNPHYQQFEIISAVRVDGRGAG